jgi:hypothetical protein
MPSLMQTLLGQDWEKLPPALLAHYTAGSSVERGHLDIHFPRPLQPLFRVLHLMGALIHRRGSGVATEVRKQDTPRGQAWQRRMQFADGQVVRFDSLWVAGRNGTIIEYVNPLLALEMTPYVQDKALHYRGERYLVRLGRWQLPLPEWLLLGHTTIVEHAISDTRFAMDFRLTHPLLGEIFRYCGEFDTHTPH